MGYTALKIMIKYKRKSAEELKAYCDAYLATGKISESQYEELYGMIEG